MSTLTFTKMKIPGGHLGKHGDYPIMFKQKMFEKGSVLDETEGLFINFGNVTHGLPYASLDDYDHSEELREFDVAVLENEYLKATFAPTLGGRMWSLNDKKAKRDLIINNPIFRPCNLSTRNAWFCGGVEWNCGVRGHSPLTCDRVAAARYEMADGTPVLRLYAFERVRAITFQMDFFLKDDSPFLFARMRLVNGTDKMTPIYWWSTIAVKQEEGARVVVPASETYVNFGSDPVYKIPIPMVDGVDQSYPSNHKVATDHFYKIPLDARKFEAYVKKDGEGFIHASTRRLKGRKMFVWGTSQGGENWQKFLTNKEGEKQPYCEIQAGLAYTQNESLPFPPNTAWEWLEAYGAISMPADKVHGEYQESRKNIQSWLDQALPESRMDTLLADTKEDATSPAAAVMQGLGWGALDNEMKTALGKKPIASYLDFGETTQEQLPWQRLLKNGYMDEPDPKDVPASFMIQDEWFEMLKATVKKADAHNWYAWYHLGICYYAREDYERAYEMFERSLSLTPSTWGYHALANVCFALGEDKKGTFLISKALSLNSENLPLAKEAMRFAYEVKEYDLMLSMYGEMKPEHQKDALILSYYAIALAHTGKLEEAKAIFDRDGGLVIEDRREGDDATAIEYTYIVQELAKKNGKEIKAEDVKVPEALDYRMFHVSK
jgi:tetratricopeptide (TPR) repeat protein